MTIFEHPILRYVAPFMQLSSDERGNVDVLQPPDRLRELALEVVVNCISCGAVMHPFRVRATSKRSRVGDQQEERRLFYSGTCPADRDAGCARTLRARDHKAMVKRWFEGGKKIGTMYGY